MCKKQMCTATEGGNTDAACADQKNDQLEYKKFMNHGHITIKIMF